MPGRTSRLNHAVHTLGLAAAFTFFSVTTALAQVIDTTLRSPDNRVNAVVRSGGTIYIGGEFARVGPATGGALPLDASTGLPQGLPKVLGIVYAVAPDGSGGWYVGGLFTSVGGVPRSNIARINPDNTVSAWNPSATGNAGGNVFALAVSGSTVFAGGDFTTIGGQARKGLAALDATSGLATAWNPNGDDGTTVLALAVSGSTVYAGGGFTTIGGQARSNIAALDATSGLATAWNPNANNLVHDLVVSGSTIYAGGRFTNIGVQARNRIAALDAASGNATTWNPNANDEVIALAVSGSTVYAGGGFHSIGGQARNRLAALDAASGLATAWNPDADGEVAALAVNGGTVYAGGSFTSIGAQARNNLAALSAASGVATAWNPNPNSAVFALAVSGGTVYAGGTFTGIGGQVRNRIAALDAASGLPTAWDPNANDRVFALAVSGSTVYAGGAFTTIGGQARSDIAALDAASGLATAWNPSANGIVRALVVSGSTVYVGGTFTTIGGQARNNLAALDLASGLATAWDPNASGAVYTLAVSGGTVYAGGAFTTIGGQGRNRLAALDAAGGLATSWDPNANGTVKVLAVSGSTVYAGGAFTTIGGQGRNRLAALDAASGLATAWDPNSSGEVYALALSGCTVYAGGGFRSIGGQARTDITALDAASGLATGWNPNPNLPVMALAVSGSTLFAGGDFTNIGGQPQACIAAISTTPRVDAVQPTSGGDDGSVTVTISGVNLASCSAVRLARSGYPDIPGTRIIVPPDELSLAATFDLRGAASGVWDVVVENPSTGTATLPNGFTVEAVAAPQLRVDMVGPDSIRASHPTAFDLVIANPGNVDAQAVPLWITGIPTDASVTLDFPLAAPLPEGGEPDWSQVPDTLTSAAGRYLALVLPRIPPGSVTRRMFLTVPASHPSFQLRAALTPPWADGAAFRTCLSDNGVITDAACMGTQLAASNAYLANTTGIAALNGIALWARIGWQCEGAGTLPAAIAEARQALDFMVQPVEQPGAAPASCGETLRPRWRDSLAVMVVGSIDPNEKVGKRGTLSSRQTIPYAIHFENDSTATAYAQRVTVSDVLPVNVDVNTVSLVAITFGDTQLHPLPGLSHGSWDVDLGPSRNVVVRVEAGFTPPAVLTRQLVWSFTSLNRTTLEPLDPGSFNGFLPPNHAPPEGEGSVVFTVMPFEGLSTGTEIQNHGMITFDYNAPQATEVWKNTVDNTPPASRVLPLSAKQDSATFTVSWEAIGAPPDLKDFTIYASEDAGAYRVWRLNTVASADTFAGRRGRSYAFYCQARDTIGNIEPAHASPDAETLPLVAVGEASPLRLALAGAWPNPAFGVIQAWFTLPSRAPATLDLIDVAGRRVQRREVGTLGPGPHMVVLAPQRLRPGLYFLRLAQGGRALTARVALIR